MSSLLKSHPETANDDLVERGQNTYRRTLASVLEPSHDGEFVAVEPDSGRYFLGSTASAALVAAHAAIPTSFSTSRALVERPRTPSAVAPQESPSS
jgi:hypothetical protein